MSVIIYDIQLVWQGVIFGVGRRQSAKCDMAGAMRDELIEAAQKSSSVTFRNASDELDRINPLPVQMRRIEREPELLASVQRAIDITSRVQA